MPVIQPFTCLKYSLNEQVVLREGIGIIKKKKKQKTHQNKVIIGTGSCKSNYLMISNPMDPGYIVRALLI
jgi:serine/threonine protein kinase HipA of HipAB toxin-antitoxin module